MKRLLLGLLLWSSAAAAQTKASGERVVLRTNFGDIVVALHPEGAPLHVARFLELARSGAYDGVEIFKIDPKRMIHVSGTGRPGTRLAPEPGALPHRYGTLTFARAPNDPDASGTSFAVMLADVPAMDGRFTSFGEVEDGLEILETIRGIPTGPDGRPIERVAVEKSFVREAAAAGAAPGAWVFPALVLAAGLGLSFFAGGRGLALARSAGLLLALAGFFLLFAAYAPRAAGSRWLGAALLAGAVGVFFLMTRFETSRSLGPGRPRS